MFGRMESQEGDGTGLDDDDEEDERRESCANIQNHAVPVTSAAMRRSQFRRLPSYPYYSTDHFTAGGDYLPGNWNDDSQHVNYTEPCPNPSPPPPATSLGYTFVPITEQPTFSTGPPPPSYESLQLQH